MIKQVLAFFDEDVDQLAVIHGEVKQIGRLLAHPAFRFRFRHRLDRLVRRHVIFGNRTIDRRGTVRSGSAAALARCVFHLEER